MKPGLYDTPVNRALKATLDELGDELASVEGLEPGSAPRHLARVVEDRLRRALEAVGGRGGERLDRQVRLVNDVLELLERSGPPGVVLSTDSIAEPGRLLTAVRERGADGLSVASGLPRPRIPLSSSDLLVNGRHDLRLGSELRRELASADRVDLLCSFLKWSGFRVLEGELRALLRRRPGGLRVLTTAYMGATDRRALDTLAGMGAEVRVSYDVDHTRLHAKAWLIHRESGFSTGYVGSSNLSAAAMLDGLEWNVRLSNADNSAILEKFSTCFEQYWSDPEFRPYDPATDAKAFDEAVKRQVTDRTRLIMAFDIEPRPHQQEMLDALTVEREAGHRRNLLVAATGTGKTVVAALDFRRLVQEQGDLSLLFVAHRQEILEQARTTYQVVMKDGAFGELLAGGEVPRVGERVFASIQSLTAERLQSLPPDAFDVVVVDEFHHAAAATYERLLQHVRPRYLLGMTATPERADGRSVLHWFEDRVTSDLRLWKALDQGLLSPFQYFGVVGPSLRGVTWSRGRYDVGELREVYTGDDFFVRRILQELNAKVADVSSMRALGFCVDIAHAEFMARRFESAGISSRVVTGQTSDRDRRDALDSLRRGTCQVVFSVDVFNEGVDLPDVDTILLLRPTESATLFLQQIGRGLRRTPIKDCCTILDFIGSGANRKFRFDLRFRAILGGTRATVRREIQEEFPHLPSGCAIHLEREVQETVLENLRNSIGGRRNDLVDELRTLGDVPLQRFLSSTGLDIQDVYSKPGASFTDLRRRAGYTADHSEEVERAFGRMLHLDDPLRLSRLRVLVGRASPPEADDGDWAQRVLYVLLGNVRRSYSGMAEAWRRLWTTPALLAELRSLLVVLDDRRRQRVSLLTDTPLAVHGTYTLDEVMAAIDQRTKKDGVMRIQTGVYQASELATDLLFVTLEKQERDYSPTTLYRDYPIDALHFHWESQSSCHEDTPTGRRYTRIGPESEDRALLFVRARRRDERGFTAPYQLLGPVWYERHVGGRPMQIVWRLQHPIPPGTYQETKVAPG